MFGNIFGNLEEKQQEIKEQLDGILVESQSGDGQVVFKMTAAKKVTAIEIHDDLLNTERKDELIDLLTIAMQDGLDQAAAKEQELSQDLIQNMLPGMGGLSGLGDLFK